MLPADQAGIPPCQGPRARSAPISFAIPKGAWDTHLHVFGPTAVFPYAEKRPYTPPDSPLEDYLALMERLGIERGVCVHPNVHGIDNSVTIDAVERSDRRLLGIIKPHRDMTFTELRDLKTRGVRGVRFAFNPQHGSGALDTELFERMHGWCRELDWCIDMHFAPDALEGLCDLIAGAETPIIIDHFGRVETAAGVNQLPFKILRDLATLDHVWIKLTGADRISHSGVPYDDVVPFAHALSEIAPDRLLWGSDWPHSGYFDPKRMPDDGDLLNLVARFAPDVALRHKILVDNPARLFGAI